MKTLTKTCLFWFDLARNLFYYSLNLGRWHDFLPGGIQPGEEMALPGPACFMNQTVNCFKKYNKLLILKNVWGK
ncbi:MAG: hypothetical protein D5R98_09265 [Desulfonatronovibrio sp. MSAO_Bac4]|nr:MAG: hypothetical protein D5R98_09265 [Desulfonatronovibrio sp. MSAO_Bac4]